MSSNDISPRPWLIAAWLLGGAVCAALVALRGVPDDRLAIRMARTLLASGVMTGLVLALVGAAVAILSRRVRLAPAILVGFTTGFVGNSALVLGLAVTLDEPLFQSVERLRSLDGFVEIESVNGRVDWIKQTPQGGYEHSERCAVVPALAKDIVVAVEDRRFYKRAGVLDIRAAGRAVAALRTGRVEGASGLAPQLAGVLLDIDTQNGPVGNRALNKIYKMLAGERLDDLFSRNDIAALYLAAVPFGVIAGHEVIGICAAARVFYGRPVDQLGPVQLAELIARLPNPLRFTAVRRPADTDSQWAARYTRSNGNFLAVMRRLNGAGLAAGVESSAMPALPSHDQLVADMSHPRLAAIFDAIEDLGLDPARQRLRVRTNFDRRIQTALSESAGEALSALGGRAHHRGRVTDRLVVDATVIDEEGGILAEAGLAMIPGGSSSIAKPNAFGAAIESGALRSMDSPVNGMRARDALVVSDNEAALAIAAAVGPQKIYDVAVREGQRPTGPFPALVLGAGLVVSPRMTAGSYAKWAPWSPGVNVVPTLLVEVTDRGTGQVLYEPRRDPVFSPRTAREIAGALEEVPLRGTATVLRPLAEAGTMLVKTGTAGFYRNGRWLGEGGSYAAGCDVPTRVCFAVRVRWSSGHPLEINGGQSAAIVVRNLVAKIRAMQEVK